VAKAILGLGSNQGDPVENIRRALTALREVGEVVAVSGAYLTAPVGFTEQPDFVNAVAIVQTELAPEELLSAVQEIETSLGRRRTFRWGPRVIDIDILFYGEESVDLPGLRIPHPAIAERLFVLAPLAEIAPDQPIPDGGTVREAAAALEGKQRCERMSGDFGSRISNSRMGEQ